jgi:hypothetical protein
MGVRPSTGTVGDANAMAESFFASLEAKLIDRQLRVQGPGAHGRLCLD